MQSNKCAQTQIQQLAGEVASGGQGQGASAYAPAAAGGGGQQDQWAHLPPMEKKIVYYIMNSAPPEDGIHVSVLTKGLGQNVNAADVRCAACTTPMPEQCLTLSVPAVTRLRGSQKLVIYSTPWMSFTTMSACKSNDTREDFCGDVSVCMSGSSIRCLAIPMKVKRVSTGL